MTINANEKYDFAIAKKEYREFCDKEKHDIQIFALPWYLDAVCRSQDEWRVIIYKENGRIVAAFPFAYYKTSKGAWIIENPWQAARLGIWIDYRNHITQYSRENFENDVTEFVIDKLPRFDRFDILFDARYKNWRAFYNRGFSQQTRYSYVVRSDGFDGNEFLQSMGKSRRRGIKNAGNNLSIEKGISFNTYWDFFESSYRQRERKLTYTREQFKSFFDAVITHEASEVFVARDTIGNICAVDILVFDGRRAYSMFGTFDPTKQKASDSLITFEGIVCATKSGKDFDFEGSMIPSVARYNMEFNAELEPYFEITKYSPRKRLYMNLKESISIIASWFRTMGNDNDRECNA